MGVTKISLHTTEQIEIAEIAKVLAHPARVAILQYISKQEGCICNDIVDEVGLAQPTISQHLQVIRKAGL
ncbi:metalloregulator ArsR/SmtB family transcription factor, partial [Altibacter sp.]